MGIHMRSIWSNTIHCVRIARFNSDVKAMSKLYPCSLSKMPASLAPSLPYSERLTSIQPVNRFSLFQTLSPWRSRTILCILKLPFLGRSTPESVPRTPAPIVTFIHVWQPLYCDIIDDCSHIDNVFSHELNRSLLGMTLQLGAIGRRSWT